MKINQQLKTVTIVLFLLNIIPILKVSAVSYPDVLKSASDTQQYAMKITVDNPDTINHGILLYRTGIIFSKFIDSCGNYQINPCTLIVFNRNHILTAAHCVLDDIDYEDQLNTTTITTDSIGLRTIKPINFMNIGIMIPDPVYARPLEVVNNLNDSIETETNPHHAYFSQKNPNNSFNFNKFITNASYVQKFAYSKDENQREISKIDFLPYHQSNNSLDYHTIYMPDLAIITLNKNINQISDNVIMDSNISDPNNQIFMVGMGKDVHRPVNFENYNLNYRTFVNNDPAFFQLQSNSSFYVFQYPGNYGDSGGGLIALNLLSERFNILAITISGIENKYTNEEEYIKDKYYLPFPLYEPKRYQEGFINLNYYANDILSILTNRVIDSRISCILDGNFTQKSKFPNDYVKKCNIN